VTEPVVNKLDYVLSALPCTILGGTFNFLPGGISKFMLSLTAPDAEMSSEQAGERNDYFHEMEERTWGRTLLLTEKRMLGLGPKESRPGDHIYFTPNFGGHIVLRKLSDGFFTWIGDAYIHKADIVEEEMRAKGDDIASDITIR
jgi:hypothetical protein